MEHTNNQYLFWFVAIRHDTVDDYVKYLEKYLDPSASYIISKEKANGVHKATNGEHIHIAAQLDVETYKKFHDNIHKHKLKLLLKAAGGVGKQVGRIKEKEVRSETKFLAYTVKDQNIIYKNIDLKTIQYYISESYPKTHTWEEQIINYFHEHYTEPEGWNFVLQGLDIEQLTNLVIRFYIDFSTSKAVPTRSFIKKLILRFLMYEQPTLNNTQLTQIYNFI